MAGFKFHVFLSHNSVDKPAVEELAVRLKHEGIEPWLDKWNLVPGDAWQPAIERALGDCAVVRSSSVRAASAFGKTRRCAPPSTGGSRSARVNFE